MPQSCTYTIIPSSLFTCQIRLNFRKLKLPQPRVDPAVVDSYQQCVDGYLEVDARGLENFRLCGENDGQHSKSTYEFFFSKFTLNSTSTVYLPIDPKNQRSMRINIVHTNGVGNSDWDIEVQQLDCPLGMSRSIDNMRYNIMNPMSTLNATALQRPFRTGKAIVSDWLAPPGCLQYHPEPIGQISSFNLNNNQGHYIGNMRYAICFRHTANSRIE